MFWLFSQSFTQKLLAEYFGRPDVSSFFAAQNPAGQLESIASVLRKSVTGDGMDVPFLKTGEGETRQVCEANVGCKCGNDRKEVIPRKNLQVAENYHLFETVLILSMHSLYTQDIR